MKSYKILSLVAVLFLAGCGSAGSSGGSNPAPTFPEIQGKWTVHASSTQGLGNSIVLADFMNQGGGSFSASQAIFCEFQPTFTCAGNLIENGTSISVQGTVTTSGALSIAFALTGQTSCTLTITGQLSGNSMSGQYTGCNDAGTWTGTTNPSSTGGYTGQLTSSVNGMTFGLSASITEGSNFLVTGSASLTGSPCFTSLTFGTPSQAVGEGILLVDPQHGVLAIAVPSEPGTNVAYVVTPTQFCGADEGTGTLSKQ